MKKNSSRRYFLLISIFALLSMSCGLLNRVVVFEESPSVSPTKEAVVVAPQPTQPPVQIEAAIPGSFDLEQKLIHVYKNANPSVVFILTLRSSGSGFVYDDDGHIVTNHHVVANEQEFEVVFANGQRERAVFVGSDIDSDLAVIKVDNLPEEARPLPLAKNELVVGQFVAAIGNPFGEQGSMSMGIISGLGRSLTSQRSMTSLSRYSLPQVIQTDAPINPGNSGGPLLNLDGEVVGINTAIATQTGANSGVGFAIPVGAVERMVPGLIQEGRYTYPFMGLVFLGDIDLDAIERLGLPQPQGAYILEVSPGSPAHAAGLIAAHPETRRGGDMIIALNDQPINNFGDLNSFLVFQASVGETIEVTLLRDGQVQTVSVTLGARP